MPTLSDGERKPLLVMHVGTGKTGTTVLQTELESLESYLNKDGYTYQGKFIRQQPSYQEHFTPLLESIMPRYEQVPAARRCTQLEGRCIQNFKDELAILRKRGQDVIISEEWAISLGSAAELRLAKAALVEWDVLVVVTYRRLWEWLPSFWRQDVGGKYMEKMLEPIPLSMSLHNFVTTFGRGQRWRAGKYTTALLEHYKPHFPVAVLNFHASKDIVANFLCNVLPGANTSCQHESRIVANRANGATGTGPVQPKIMNSGDDKNAMIEYKTLAISMITRNILKAPTNKKPQEKKTAPKTIGKFTKCYSEETGTKVSVKVAGEVCRAFGPLSRLCSVACWELGSKEPDPGCKAGTTMVWQTHKPEHTFFLNNTAVPDGIIVECHSDTKGASVRCCTLHTGGGHDPKPDNDVFDRLVASVVQFHRNVLKNEPFPLTCSDQQQLDALFELSRKHEAKVLHSPDESAHRQKFEEAVRKKKFCSIDIPKIVTNKRWDQFYKQAPAGFTWNG